MGGIKPIEPKRHHVEIAYRRRRTDAGVALARDETTTHKRPVVQNPDGSNAVQASKTQTATDAFGNQATEKKTFSKTDDGVDRQVTRSVETEAPTGATTTTSQTTTVGR